MPFLRKIFSSIFNNYETSLPIVYIFTVTMLIISLQSTCTYCSASILVFICFLFIIEGLLLLQKYKNTYIDKLLKIWKYGQYVIMSVIAIWAMSETNGFIYMQLHENPNNYPLTITALVTAFTIVNILIIFSWIFFITAMIFAWSGTTIFIRIGRSIALFTFISLYILKFDSITNDLGKKIILDTSFVQNFHCSNPIVLNQKIAFSSDNKLVLFYNPQSKKFDHTECDFMDFLDKHSIKTPK